MRVFFSFLFLISFLFVQAQESIGLTGSNKHGIQSSFINPANLHNSENYIEFDLFSADVFLNNRTFYYPGLLSQTTGGELDNGQLTNPIVDTTLSRFLNLTGKIGGPSFMYIHHDHAFAVYSRVRSDVRLTLMEYHLSKWIEEGGLDYEPYHGVNFKSESALDFEAMAWGEIGGTYAYKLMKSNRQELVLGVSAKLLLGGAALSINADSLDYMVENSDLLHIYDYDGDFSVSAPNGLGLGSQSSGFVQGYGLGFDIGLTYTYKKHPVSTYQNKKACQIPYEDYDYRIGVSLIDVGGIRYNKNTRSMTFQNGETHWPGIANPDFASVIDGIDQVEERLENEYSTSTDKFTMYLPSAVSVQFDQNINNVFFIGATFVQGFRLSKNSLPRKSLLAVNPRMNKGKLEIGMPLSLYNYKLPQAGFYLTYGSVTIGSDMFVKRANIEMLKDFNAYVKIGFAIGKGNCLKKKSSMSCDAYDTGSRNSKGRKKY
jgi:hypothetical protein